MHVYVICSTTHNNKDMESTQTLINDRLNKENVVHKQHGILCSHEKEWGHVLCKDINGAQSHYPQQTNAATENQTLHVLTYKWELKHKIIWTHGAEKHILRPVGGWVVGGLLHTYIHGNVVCCLYPHHLYLAFLPMLSLPNSLICTVSHLVPTQQTPVCDVPSLCPCDLSIKLPVMSENMQYLVFCFCVSLLRMMISSFIHVPAKDMNSSFLMAA